MLYISLKIPFKKYQIVNYTVTYIRQMLDASARELFLDTVKFSTDV